MKSHHLLPGVASWSYRESIAVDASINRNYWARVLERTWIVFHTLGVVVCKFNPFPSLFRYASIDLIVFLKDTRAS